MFVRDEMTANPITIEPDASVSEAERLMVDNKIRHLPVVRANGTLAGLITRTSLQQVLPSKLTTLDVWEMHYQLEKLKVGDAMVRDVTVVAEDVPIEQAARIMLDKKIGSLVVTRGDRVVGIITDIDLMRAMMALLGAPQPGVRVTLKVPDAAGVLSKVTTAIAEKKGYISALGTIPSDEPLKWVVLVKVRYVESDALTAALKEVEGVEIIDVRCD